jgi:hypothetical protein
MVRALALSGLLAGCTATGLPDGGGSADAGRDVALPDVPIVDVGPLPDGFEWARCEDYVAAGSPPTASGCDPATFGSCADPRAIGCAVIYQCDPTLRRIESPLIC